MTREYKVTWEIELDANSTRQAAMKAWLIMLDPQSTAVCFEVERSDGKGEAETIDLEAEQLYAIPDEED
jgi:hypothetical protein